MTKPTNRLDRLSSAIEARQWGECAATFNERWDSNPYEVGSYLWIVWGEAFNRTIERLAATEEQSQ